MLTLAVFAGAAVLGLTATFAARGAGRRFGLVDNPDGRRKIHARPVPVSGGLGVLVAAVVALGLAALLSPDVADGLFADAGRVPSPAEKSGRIRAEFAGLVLAPTCDIEFIRNC